MTGSWFRTKWSIFLGTAVVVGLVSLTGCSAAPSSGGPTTVKFSYLWGGPEAAALEKIIAQYNASQREVVVVGVSSPDSQKQLTSMSSSSGSFDLSDNFGQNVGAWASKGILAPLDGYIASQKIDTSDFVGSALDQMKYNDKTYALPIAIHTVQLLYNKTLLADAGIKPPTTMDELAKAADTLTRKDSSGAIQQLGLGDASTATTLTTLGFAFGGSWDDAQGPSPTDPHNIAALSWYQDNVVTKVGASNLSTFVAGEGQYLSAQDAFFSGKVAMIMDGEWRSVSAGNVAPSLDWGVTAIPTAAPGLEDSTQVTASTLFIPANSQNKDAAAKFLAYMVGTAPMTDFTVALGNLPSRTSLLKSDAYKNLKYFDVWANASNSKNAKSLASKPYSAEYASDLSTAFDQVVRGASSPQTALEQVQSRVPTYATK